MRKLIETQARHGVPNDTLVKPTVNKKKKQISKFFEMGIKYIQLILPASFQIIKNEIVRKPI